MKLQYIKTIQTVLDKIYFNRNTVWDKDGKEIFYVTYIVS